MVENKIKFCVQKIISYNYEPGFCTEIIIYTV